ncbi:MULTISPECIES: DMT family transporter [Burkholderia]|uniref:hypothetical protein n=1 Tax=Burkholderia TaxID=32008 RepID=UPI00158B63C7|nr:hypothetical protein [Burkholderia cepacia]HEM7888871.1 hypothetical protein [Burkholderia cepacia]HEM8510106.1 hypothetical protein [Burkholderia cepacia]
MQGGAARYGRSFQGMSPAGSLIVGAIVLVPASLAADRPWTLHPSSRSLPARAAIAFVIYFRLVQTLGSVGTTAQACLRVPIGIGIGMALLGESRSASAWLGLACVVAGVAAMTLPSRQCAQPRA